jgi:sigma-E factor negative regulatory protein RseA
MNKRTPDTISSLVDNELNEWEVIGALQSLQRDKTLQACWRNYHLIGDAMRGNLPKYVALDLAERVRGALEHEPFHLKPQNPAPTIPVSPAHSRTKTAIGFALAASLSAVAILGVLGVEQRQKLHGTAQVASATSQDVPVRAAGGPSSVTVAKAPAAVETVPVAMPADAHAQPGAAVVTATRQDRQPVYLGTWVSARPSLASAAVVSATTHRSQTYTGTEAQDGGRSFVARSSLPTEGDLYDYLMNPHRYETQGDGEDALLYLRVVSYASSQ